MLWVTNLQLGVIILYFMITPIMELSLLKADFHQVEFSAWEIFSWADIYALKKWSISIKSGILSAGDFFLCILYNYVIFSAYVPYERGKSRMKFNFKCVRLSASLTPDPRYFVFITHACAIAQVEKKSLALRIPLDGNQTLSCFSTGCDRMVGLIRI